jgi:putative nucleotidyltransferase with HDIG domain
LVTSLPGLSDPLQTPLLRAVREAAQILGGQAWLVGGAVRDWLLTGELPLDLDFTLIDCPAETLAAYLAESLSGHLVPLDLVFGIHRVVLADGLQLDLADALQNNLEADLARRDLTINAMALNLDTGELLDPFDGQGDLGRGQIRMLSAATLLDDPLRLLRVFRVAASIQAQAIEPDTLAVVRDHAAAIWQAAPERIHYELFRLLNSERCFPYLHSMADCGLLEALIPDLTPMKAIGAGGFHHLGLFDHTLELVRQAERLLPECPPETQEWLRSPFNGVVSRMGLLKLGCLLHDIGKPATMGTRKDAIHGTRLTFYQHEEVGEQMAEPWLRKMKVGNDVREHVKTLIRWHLYPCQFGPDSPRRSVLRYYRRLGGATLDTTLLALADRHSSCGEWLTPEALRQSHEAHLWLMATYHQEQGTLLAPRLLGGQEIMHLLAIGPGPEIGRYLDALQEAQQLGEIKTPEEAAQWLLVYSQSEHSVDSRQTKMPQP